MNTDNSAMQGISNDTKWSIGREILSVLNSCTINLSKEQTLQELHLAVERLPLGSESIGPNLSVNDIENLLNGDVSADFMSFLQWLHHRKIIGLMVGNNGRLMLSFCSEYYRSVQQLQITTPISLSESFRIRLLEQLRVKYPEPARIVFETAPSLVAGCIIDDSRHRTDMSLRNKAPKLIGELLAAYQSQRTATHA